MAEPKTKVKRSHRLTFLLLVGLALLIGSIYLGVANWLSSRQAAATARHNIALANAGKPSPAPATVKPSPAAIAAYSVPATHPRYLKIPKLGVNARVYAVGLTKAGAIGTPDNVFDAAWFNQTSLPGKPGAMLIDGHVSSWTTRGIFYDLKSLSVGDTMHIETGNGTVYQYKVMKTQTYEASSINVQTLLTPIDSQHPGLNLITCAGDVIKGTNDFNKRIVVFAEQI